MAGNKQLSKFKNLFIKNLLIPERVKIFLKIGLSKEIKIMKMKYKKRFESFDKDISNWNDYDYILINKSLEVCFETNRNHNK